MTAQQVRSAARASDRVADILVVGDAAVLDPMAAGTATTVRSIGLGPAGERALRGMLFGVVVVVVPPADDATVVRVAHLRRGRPDMRAVLVDPAGAPDRRLAALQAGFDDALPRESGAAEIGARIAIQLMRIRAVPPTRLAVGPDVELDLESRALRRRGRFVHLRPLEFRLLEALCRAPGRPLSRAWLIDQAWGIAPPTGSRTIDVHIRWLREKVEHDPEHPVHLLTVRGIGYQLVPDEPDLPDPPAAPDATAG